MDCGSAQERAPEWRKTLTQARVKNPLLDDRRPTLNVICTWKGPFRLRAPIKYDHVLVFGFVAALRIAWPWRIKAPA
jgi:hypothetical protein